MRALLMWQNTKPGKNLVIPVLSHISEKSTSTNMTIRGWNTWTTNKNCVVETLDIQQAWTYKITLCSPRSNWLFVWINDSPINIDYTSNTDNDEITSKSVTVVVTVSTSDILKVWRWYASGSTQYMIIYVEKIDIQSWYISLSSS